MTAEVRFTAIGTTAHLLVTDPSVLADAATMLREFLADLDIACSRFREDSTLSQLNRTGSVTHAHPLLLATLAVALNAAEQTDGLVDPTLGSYMVSLGYDRTFTDVPRWAPEPVGPLEPKPRAWQDIRVDGDSVALPAGVRLDLGATAKAWAADTAATSITTITGSGALVNLGGDVAVAGPAPEGGWQVRVSADHTDEEGGQVVALNAGGLATSSTTVRAWQRGDQDLHHVLNPATGMPARRVWQYATVCAASCADANTASTAAIVLGERAASWLAERHLPARLVSPGGAVTTVAEWPEEGT